MAYNLGQVDPEQPSGLYADDRDEDDRPRPRRLLRVGAALLLMAVFAGGLWLAYVAGRHQGGGQEMREIPLIRADTSPFKVKPQNPGGMAIPDRDLMIYGAHPPQVEHLLPPPEQPMPRPSPPSAAPAALPGPPLSAAQSGVASAGGASTTPAPASGNAAPAAAAGATSVAPAQPVAAEMRAAAAPTPPRAPASDPIGERIDQIAAAERAARTRAAHLASAKPGELRLQLGAVRSEGEARGAWLRLKQGNADLLGKLSAAAVRADLGDKGVFYRIQAGPVASSAAADHICTELRQRGLACIVIR